MLYLNQDKGNANTPPGRAVPGESRKMEKLKIRALTKEYGCMVYTEIQLPEDYTMNMVVNEIKRHGFQAFQIIGTMRRFVYI